MRRFRRGAHALEFAVLAPAMLAMVTGMVDYCWIFMLRDGATHAARAGARVGAVTAPTSGPESAAAEAALDTWRSLGLGADPTVEAFRGGDPELIVVRVTVPATPTIGLVVTPGTVAVLAAEKMERQP